MKKNLNRSWAQISVRAVQFAEDKMRVVVQ